MVVRSAPKSPLTVARSVSTPFDEIWPANSLLRKIVVQECFVARYAKEWLVTRKRR